MHRVSRTKIRAATRDANDGGEKSTMRTTNPRSTVTSLGLALALLLASTPGAAGILDATWTAPTTNTDGSPLTDLASYRVYYGTSGSPCAGSSWMPVASPTPSPGAGQRVSVRLTGLTTGASYNVAVSAIDAVGTESPCSNVASAVSRSELAVSPTGSVSFGTVALGSFAEQSFTVSNTTGGTISGSASVAAPFSVVSGTPFTLAGQGATQTVRVRFTPTVATTVSTTLTFAAAGGTLATILTGTGAAAAVADATAPTISGITTSVTASGAVIGWTTNEPSDTQVEYGSTKSYGSQAPLNTSLQTTHMQTIGGLKPNTWYHFRVRSRDAAGNLSVSKDFRFKTSR
jgi:hypothetical protein